MRPYGKRSVKASRGQGGKHRSKEPVSARVVMKGRIAQRPEFAAGDVVERFDSVGNQYEDGAAAIRPGSRS